MNGPLPVQIDNPLHDWATKPEVDASGLSDRPISDQRMDSRHFIKMYLPDTSAMDDRLLLLLRQKKLQPRDLVVVRALQMCMCKAAGRDQGRIKASAAYLAELSGTSPPHVSTSLTRLRKEYLLVRCLNRRSGEVFYLLDPHLWAIGRAQKEGHLWSQFKEAFDRGGDVED